VPNGSIYGFLGANGAGKTTTLRLLLGLLKKQQGTIHFFGKSFDQNRISSLKRTGSLIESPSMYSQLSAMENLMLLQKIYRCSKNRLREVLQQVGLSEMAKKKTSQFSMGMKQRLGIAIALMNQPDLLILDEPTNGLDPNGIIEMRELLKSLNKEKGTTILLSSHLLSEIEKLVSHTGIIDKGKLLFQGTLQALINKQELSSQLIFDTSDNEKALHILFESGIAATPIAGKIQLLPISTQVIASIVRKLVAADIDVQEISHKNNDLETVFMDLINR
jgi:ABC-2 type transport system ATP-binding protein